MSTTRDILIRLAIDLASDARYEVLEQKLHEMTLSAFEAGAGWGQAREQDRHFMGADRLDEVHGTQERAHAEWLRDWVKDAKEKS